MVCGEVAKRFAFVFGATVSQFKNWIRNINGGQDLGRLFEDPYFDPVIGTNRLVPRDFAVSLAGGKGIAASKIRDRKI
jgi:hypothetical protein